MSDTSPVKYHELIGDIFQAMQAMHKVMEAHGLERGLVHLVRLRASQINGCAFCVKMHIREAREHGETSERLDRLVVWRHVGDFSAREKAAFAWTEALTELDPKAGRGELRAQLRTQFTDKEIAALTAEVATINYWNRIQVSGH